MANGHDHDYPEDRVPADLLLQMGYETRDVGPKAILTWIAGLFVFIGIVTWGVLVLEDQFVPETGQVAYESEFFRTQPIRNEPPQPQLQILPKRDMIMYRKDEIRHLNGHNVLPNGKITIPVDDAINSIAAEGISGVTATAPTKTTDAYPGSGKYAKQQPDTAEAPQTNDASEAQTAAPAPTRAGDVLTDERKNVPNESHEQGGHSTNP